MHSLEDIGLSDEDLKEARQDFNDALEFEEREKGRALNREEKNDVLAVIYNYWSHEPSMWADDYVY